MQTAPLKSFATLARTALIREVNARVAAVLAPGSRERIEQAKAVAALERAVAANGGGKEGRAAVAEKVAYTWFNRIIALRFMDANSYTGVGVVSPQAGVKFGQPEILAEAKRGVIDAEVVSAATRATVGGLLDGTRASGDPQGEAYALLLADYCRYWNKTMPFMFEREGDYTELLIPANLLADDSVLNRAVYVLTEEVCADVEVIGWLYQFYISERKEEVFAAFKKNKKAGAEEIPAATQLFTPHWIVRYLVENSIGRLWMLNRPSSRLVEQMDYYIPPVEDETGFLRITRPEDLTVIDPACGSGHLLTYAFDLLYAIYEEEGYAPSEIPSLILANNIFGAEIDPRAGALASFALTMKARARQRTFLNREARPQIAILEPRVISAEDLSLLDMEADLAFWNQFANADTLGALVQPDAGEVARARMQVAAKAADHDLLAADVVDRASALLRCADVLSREYAAVVANPPYMGWKNMGGILSSWVKDRFLLGKQDLYAAFILRARTLVMHGGTVAMITGDSWLTMKTFAGLRQELLEHCSVPSVLHLQDSARHADTFGANAAFILDQRRSLHRRSRFVYLEPLSPAAKQSRLLEALQHPRSPAVFDVETDHFEDVPGAPFAYRLTDDTRRAFREHPSLGEVATPLQGLATADDGRFLRRWWEVSRSRVETAATSREEAAASGARWFPLTKGGAYRRWYGNHEYVVNWESDGHELTAFARSVIRNPSTYFRASVNWGRITAGSASFRYSPEGFIFGDKGPAIVARDYKTLLAMLAYANSSSATHLLQILSPTLGYEVGHISNLPAPASGELSLETCESLVELSKTDWDSSELSWEFSRPAFIQPGRLRDLVADAFAEGVQRATTTVELEQANDESVASALGLSIAPASFGIERVSLFTNPYYGCAEDAPEDAVRAAFTRRLASDLVSYAVGCMFGRYSLDRDGLVLADHGATFEDYVEKVRSPSFPPDIDGVIPVVDGDWFEDDIVGRFRQFLRVALGEQHFEENLRFVNEALGVKSLRDYFVRSFYKDHVQRYKKRPIYWLFASPSGSFNALIYMHRYETSTVSTVLNEYLREFQAKLRASLEHAERSNNAKEADRLRKVLLELDEYEHDVLYPLASRNIAIDLDDGVKANYSKFGTALRKIPGLEAAE